LPTIGLIDRQSAAGPIADAYRSLFAALSPSLAGDRARSLLVTACDARCPRNGVAANLALAAASAGYRVRLVDADVRRPALHVPFGVANTPGFADLLNGALPDTVRLFEVAGLSFLPAGRSAETQASAALPLRERLDAVLRALSDGVALLILDVAPILCSPDAVVLAGMVDDVLVVAEPGATRRDDARRTRALLDRIGSHLVGVATIEPSARLPGSAA